MNRINLIWEKRQEYYDEVNKRFHTKLQLCLLAAMGLIVLFCFIYG